MTLLNNFWRKNLPWIILLIFFYFVIVFLIFLPSITQTETNKQTIIAKQEELETLDYRLQILQKRTHNSDVFNEINSKINNLMPNNTDTSVFIIQLENLANLNGTIINNLSITEPKADSKQVKTKQTQSIAFSFDVNTSYATLLNIIKGLESFPRFNTTTSINLITHDDNNISAQIKGVIYYGK
ncbi:MAG: hypothetical protein WCO23_03215 [bacterium]